VVGDVCVVGFEGCVVGDVCVVGDGCVVEAVWEGTRLILPQHLISP